MSDLHGRLPKIPECDVLLLAGDLAPDFHRQAQHDPDLMRVEQMKWLGDVFYEWEQSWPSSVQACFATPGNHDWFTRIPDHCRTQLCIDEMVMHADKMFWFTPWVIPCGDWNYQLPRDQRKLRFADIPRNLDVLISHGPAFKCLDRTYANEFAGCPELRQMVYEREPKHMIFGHIHEGRRYGTISKLGNTMCYNVAMWGDWSPTMIEV